jgi:hypothetical protein
MAGRRKGIGIVLIVLDVVAWGAFAYFLIKIITSATSITSCNDASCAGQGAEDAANYVPWIIGTAFAASIILTLLILWYRMQPSAGGPTSWDQVAQMSTGAPSTAAGNVWPAAGPTVSPTSFALPGAGPTWSPTMTTGGAQASIVATRTVNSTPAGTEMQIDMDVTVPGQAPRRVTKQMTVPPGSLARLYTGAVVPVTVNPGDPNDVTPMLGG